MVQVSAFDLHQEAVRGEEAASRAEEGRVQILVMDKLNGLPQLLRFLFRKKVMKRNPVNFMVAGSSSTWERRESGRCGDDRSEKGMRGCSSDLGEKKPDLLLLEPFPLVDNSMIEMEEQLENRSTILDDCKGENPEIVILLQQPNPIKDAHYYPKEKKK